MASVNEISTPRNPAKVYYAQYLDLAGVLTRPADRVLFLEPHSGAVVTLSPEEVLRDVVINGEVAAAMAQYLSDMAAGGYAKVCTSRPMLEV